jgi:hypothetical protein
MLRYACSKASCAVAGMYPSAGRQMLTAQVRWTSEPAGWVDPVSCNSCSTALSEFGKARPLALANPWMLARIEWRVCQGMGGAPCNCVTRCLQIGPAVGCVAHWVAVSGCSLRTAASSRGTKSQLLVCPGRCVGGPCRGQVGCCCCARACGT